MRPDGFLLDRIDRLRDKRWSNLLVVNLRILIGFAFVPAGLKKVLDQPFTDLHNSGPFHDFLHVFHATGVFYQFVGCMQLVIAVLLMTQTFATLGALMALPVFLTITVFCWSTQVYPTAIMVTLMLSGTCVLVLWDHAKWRAVLRPEPAPAPQRALPTRPEPAPSAPPTIDLLLWRRCGAGILVLYFAICALAGGVYRPRGVELDNPAFYMMPLIALFPVITVIVEQVRRRRARRAR